MLRDIISNKLVSCGIDAKVDEVSRLMSEENVGSVLVLENEKPIGIVTDRDIVLRCVAKKLNAEDCSVESIMSESLQTVKDTDGIFDCITAMKQAGVRRIPVVDSQDRGVGIVSFGDLLGVLSKEFIELTSSTTPSEMERQKAA